MVVAGFDIGIGDFINIFCPRFIDVISNNFTILFLIPATENLNELETHVSGSDHTDFSRRHCILYYYSCNISLYIYVC
ncbi:hypothetical protein NY2A_b464L [Paramecium bursaria Chlorella virus NY2A]|uniref:Uncharacterized protein b464L n=1 Tax=Paramecium bursaria Chlorella virus NY2A TaxID=46021 RepID=A7IWY9_PBCVN|nr:hypothetical protein NY2A_b464L [Paramecium bursaria Chlorella virus NY2A]ABT14863.1 hypothetical protein NY2A_b464L [Paramecium bursaria Chlorella virus NY2A]